MDDQTQAFMDQINAIHAARVAARLEKKRILKQQLEEKFAALVEIFRGKLLELGLDMHPDELGVEIGNNITIALHHPGIFNSTPDEIRRKSKDCCLKVYAGSGSSFWYAKNIEEFVTALESARYFDPKPVQVDEVEGREYPNQYDADAAYEQDIEDDKHLRDDSGEIMF